MHLINSSADAHKLSADSAGAESAGAPDDEIEVTPEMLKAGEWALCGSLTSSLIHPAVDLAVLAKKVFVEMDKRRRPPSGTERCS